MHNSIYSDELDPKLVILAIPEAQRTPFQRDYAKAVMAIRAAADLPVNTLADAANYARRMLYGQWLGAVMVTLDSKSVAPKSVAVSPYVERFTAARCCWMDPATQDELSNAEAARRLRRAQQAGSGAAVLEPFMGVSFLGNVTDRTVYDRMTADELVVTLFVMRRSTLLHKGGGAYSRSCFPALAAMDVGEPHHMTAPQWETVWIESLTTPLFTAIRSDPPEPASAGQAIDSLTYMAHRLPLLDSDRAMSYRLLVMVTAEVGDDDALLSSASVLARLGEAQSHDYAFAFGTCLRMHTLLYGILSVRPRVTMGELRAAVAKAHEARKRLKKMYLWGLVQQAVRSQMTDVQRALDEMEDLPDTAVLQLPYKGRAEGSGGPAASTNSPAVQAGADSKPICDGCHKRFLQYLRCGGCRQRRYCGKECQTKDWRGGHKATCKQLAAAARAEAEAAVQAGSKTEQGTGERA
ncbi:hypothetical protein HYH03_001725 [Edaphochlamys debaryana]|uniref:MYND-type domain-containing protein n=1 Tax=Edaphochlamys debaryana TaxID=47281 RepID=A0A836C5K8_9CHLO|nr:hypothetical protein HYH03_001725 [Edaphochlamys debaryana]|eukprot:KAG2500143.1 hypothetical protein HYH03_001725 [Edaphochlamys debaryana]